MVKILFSSLILVLIAIIDGSMVFKSKDTKKIATYSSFYIAAFLLSLLLLNGVKIPNPIEPLKNFIISISGED